MRGFASVGRATNNESRYRRELGFRVSGFGVELSGAEITGGGDVVEKDVERREREAAVENRIDRYHWHRNCNHRLRWALGVASLIRNCLPRRTLP